MVEATPPRNLDQVERGVELALSNFVGRKANAGELPVVPAAERIEKISTMSARAIVQTCETAATDIERAGQSAVEIAAEVMKEAEHLATGLRANGKKIGERLQEFAMLAKKVSTTMRDTRAEVLNPTAEEMPAAEKTPLAERTLPQP